MGGRVQCDVRHRSVVVVLSNDRRSELARGGIGCSNSQRVVTEYRPVPSACKCKWRAWNRLSSMRWAMLNAVIPKVSMWA